MPPKVEGEFQNHAQRFDAKGAERFDQFLVGGMDGGGMSQAVKGNHFFGELQTLFGRVRFNHTKQAKVFRVSGSFGPTSRHSAMMMLVFSGTLNPALFGNPCCRFAHYRRIEFRSAAAGAIRRYAKDKLFEHGFSFYWQSTRRKI